MLREGGQGFVVHPFFVVGDEDNLPLGRRLAGGFRATTRGLILLRLEPDHLG
jgi:hypothetical protein